MVSHVKVTLKTRADTDREMDTEDSQGVHITSCIRLVLMLYYSCMKNNMGYGHTGIRVEKTSSIGPKGPKKTAELWHVFRALNPKP